MIKNLRITIEGKTYDVAVELLGEESGPVASCAPAAAASASCATPPPPPPPPAPVAPAATAGVASGPGAVPSPLAGKVVSIEVAVGQSVSAGQQIMTLEAMKMNTLVMAPASGTVKAIHVRPGDAVEEGQLLVSL